MTDHALSVGNMRMLHDKLYEKRKSAALEIEKTVRRFTVEGNHAEIRKIISILSSEFALSQNPNSKKGGLIGLAACAIALGCQNIQPYLDDLVKPVLVSSADADNRIRYFACESLYNIAKVSRAHTLPHFNELFDALSKLSADPDPNVRNGSDLLDRLLKDIVTETPSFDATVFISLLRERLYTKKQYTRRYLVQWLVCIMSIPTIDIVAFLPELLDPLFLVLDDESKEIKSLCQATLSECLQKIEADPEKVDFCNLINIVVVHCQSSDMLIKATALPWMSKFITLSGQVILPYASGIIGAILPTLAYEDISNRDIRETAKEANSSLMKLITPDFDKAENDKILTIPLDEMIEVFTNHLNYKSTLTKCAVIKWITHLLLKIPYHMFQKIEGVFSAVTRMLSDPADEVVILTLECLAEIASSPAGTPLVRKVYVSSTTDVCSDDPEQTPSLVLNSYFTKMIDHLLNSNNSPELLENRGSFIIRQLCTLLHAENVFRALAESLTFTPGETENVSFAAAAVKKLSIILMTSTELSYLRSKLKNGPARESSDLFCCLYKSWCHNTVAVVSLCLLTQNYQYCCRIIQKLADFELTVDILVELDKLIQLLESPIFSYIRLQLLENPPQRYLVKTLYSILMLLPQSRSFDTLNQRLNCLPDHHLLPGGTTAETRLLTSKDGENDTAPENRFRDLNFDDLFEHYQLVQNAHLALRRQSRHQAFTSIKADS